MKKAIVKFGMFLLVLSAQVQAGQNGSGGGVGFQCQKDVFLADTYKSVDEKKLKVLNLFKTENLLENAFARIENQDPELGVLLRDSYGNLNFIEREKVRLAGDDNITEVPQGCKKVAIALQDLKSGSVEYNGDLYSKLSNTDKAFLRYHEAYIQLFNGIEDTTPVRELVKNGLIRTINAMSETLSQSWDSKNIAHSRVWNYLTWLHKFEGHSFRIGHLQVKDIGTPRFYDAQSAERYGYNLAQVFEGLFGAVPTTSNSSMLLANYTKSNFRTMTLQDLANVVDLLYIFRGE